MWITITTHIEIDSQNYTLYHKALFNASILTTIAIYVIILAWKRKLKDH